MAKTLLMTVGLPRSGKSTWAQTKGFPIVNPDSVRLALHGQAFVPSAERMVWSITHYMVEALFLAGHDIVILDATNTTRKRRDDWKSTWWVRKYQVFDTPKDECVIRAKATGNNDLVLTVVRMAENYEPLEAEEWDEGTQEG